MGDEWWEGCTEQRGIKGRKNGTTVIAQSIKYTKKNPNTLETKKKKRNTTNYS